MLSKSYISILFLPLIVFLHIKAEPARTEISHSKPEMLLIGESSASDDKKKIDLQEDLFSNIDPQFKKTIQSIGLTDELIKEVVKNFKKEDIEKLLSDAKKPTDVTDSIQSKFSKGRIEEIFKYLSFPWIVVYLIKRAYRIILSKSWWNMVLPPEDKVLWKVILFVPRLITLPFKLPVRIVSRWALNFFLSPGLQQIKDSIKINSPIKQI